MTTPTRPTLRKVPTPASAGTTAKKNINKTGGGFNLKPTLNITVAGNQQTAGPAQTTGPQNGSGTPGADFASNEDIRAFSEHLRKQARNAAVERSMDAAQLEARLRHIRAADGSMSGARARARRVSRYLKLIAAAEKAIAKWATALYSAFEREYEAELIKIGKGRVKTQNTQRFNFR
ncbi:plasmid transfer protein TraA [Streptomyces sp. NPDC029006]|uniref:plasmid transfer protein TraA n=1 Tax=Streptomyces sp. NPDC029006 TaxID=3155467 RepID=UPI0033FB6B05